MNHLLHDLSRARIGELWPKLAPLLSQPFRLERQCLLQKAGTWEAATLRLGNRGLGSAGMQTVCSAVAIGALSELNELYLAVNQLGDAGLTALASVCASRAMGKLTVSASLPLLIPDRILTSCARPLPCSC